MIFTSVERTAHHEAGHAVMGMALGTHVTGIEIFDDGKGHTTVLGLGGGEPLDRVARILLAASGLTAEVAFCERNGIATQSGFVGHFKDEAAAEADLKALGQDGMFLVYVAIAGGIFEQSKYWDRVSVLGVLLKQCKRFDNAETLRSIAEKVPRLTRREIETILQTAIAYPKGELR